MEVMVVGVDGAFMEVMVVGEVKGVCHGTDGSRRRSFAAFWIFWYSFYFFIFKRTFTRVVMWSIRFIWWLKLSERQVPFPLKRQRISVPNT
jgi:hypothetical protein